MGQFAVEKGQFDACSPACGLPKNLSLWDGCMQAFWESMQLTTLWSSMQLMRSKNLDLHVNESLLDWLIKANIGEEETEYVPIYSTAFLLQNTYLAREEPYPNLFRQRRAPKFWVRKELETHAWRTVDYETKLCTATHTPPTSKASLMQ